MTSCPGHWKLICKGVVTQYLAFGSEWRMQYIRPADKKLDGIQLVIYALIYRDELGIAAKLFPGSQQLKSDEATFLIRAQVAL